MSKPKIIRNMQKVAVNIKDAAVEKKDVALDSMKQGGEKLAIYMNQAKQDYNINKLKPVFMSQIDSGEYQIPPMIHIVEADKQHLENPVCEGSLGYGISVKGMQILNLFTKDVDSMSLSFYPSAGEDVYYVDPCNPRLYISLNEYFTYLKKVRVDELNLVAQALGAKHIKISLKAEKKTFVEQKAKVKANAGKKGDLDAIHDLENKSFESIEVASESSFKGHEPKKPVLNYFKNESDVQSLIAMRMNRDNPLQNKTITFKYSNSSGIKQTDAIKIDAALAKLKVGGNASVTNEVKEESRMYFEYQIEFPDHESYTE